MQVVIRADASVEMGVGHVMRCATLAKELQAKGATVTFICRALEGNIIQHVENLDFEVITLPAPDVVEPSHLNLPEEERWMGVHWSQDAEETSFALQTRQVDLLIIDHYGVAQPWQKELRNQCKRIWVIDDLANRVHDCDLLLDQTYGRVFEDYRQLVPADCQLLLGTEYALLREEFRHLRQKALTKRKGYQRIKRILVTMGGTDAQNVTGTILEALLDCQWSAPIEIDVVLSSKAPHLASLQANYANTRLPVFFHVDAKNMGNLMLHADLAVGAGGSTSWERCCIGLPSLISVNASNQENIARQLEEQGAVIQVGKTGDISQQELEENISRMNSDLILYRNMVAAASEVCDGYGATRVAAHFENLEV